MTNPLSSRAKPQPRRSALLRAAVDVVGERGLAGATHRAVTERADVPLATASYYFSSIADLLREALEAFVAERTRHIATFDEADGERSPTEIGEWFAEEIIGLPRRHALAFYEVLINAARIPEFEQPVAEMLRHFENTGEAGLIAAGARDPSDASRHFLALALGYGLLHLSDPHDSDTADFYAALQALFSAFADDDSA